MDINPNSKNNEENQEEDLIEIPANENPETNYITKKYSFSELLKSSSCILSKEKNYIWKNSLFSEKIYEILTSNDNQEILAKYSLVYVQIENILMGDFSNAKEMTNFYKDFYYISYIITTKYDLNNNHLLFVIYYSKSKENPKYFIEYLEFLEISDEKSDLKKALNNFNFQNKYMNSDLEFDK